MKKVVDFKIKFYPRAWAKYEQAIPGILKLLPPKYRLDDLEADYIAMKDMLYGDIPFFDVSMESMGTLEREINSL